MTTSRWRDSGHLERAAGTAGGPQAFDAAVAAMLDDARGWRLAEMRKRRGLTQEQAATRMAVSVARVSQMRRGACAVATEHLRGGPAVEFHQVILGTAVVEPGGLK
jgi:hypothetical protein